MSNEVVQKTNRRKLLILILLMCAPVVVSYLLYFFEFRPGSINYGELIAVNKLSGSGVNQKDNTIFRMRDLRGKWIMMTVDSGNCDEACQTKLYHMRQVRLVQNKEKHRVERLWLIDDDISPETELAEKYEGTFFVNTKDSDLLDAIPPRELQRKYIYLIDPLGNLMMRYPEGADPTKMGKDIKRLLHVSQLEH
ncbi:Cytochrome oxidase Cu insertion factor, SCO1/SenC/PrrC family [Nitrosomonas cryotolerans]|uniref:Cytochrome oxidase Cu insertion factor, SCO1/SenC/PrrC family n=1 Tax=Nitrosomonas cryotolerans ATCC 49181 TaxID=1131553 RepID=A0A1N6GTF8_9PROT|nr:membrane protein [Nitrosomonas cryotolerans]SFP40839.1 Cytochrome oxidase Cu insertion factor, SCO1/SenC/PrrC family [Nitrosomonas cryotolerans]SIO10881.1 Cytochrome oxidase Cu insertion factor, SCO1/SenC/PrrC family [Nitrosomonas cryotolerans ATCC 49181]